MKFLWIISWNTFFLLLLPSCTSYRISYEINLVASKKGDFAEPEPYEMIYTHEVSTLKTTILCGLSFFYYGGACWGYSYVPYQEDSQEAEEAIASLLDQEFGRKNYEIWSAYLLGTQPLFFRERGEGRWHLRKKGSNE